ncbi:hypothetical protein KAU43_00280 [candidate division WOR-3 bacterium]|nr:hypothetical protein [candidate division WOR-3 bacterium]
MRKTYWAIIFILVGIFLLLSNYNFIAFNFSRDWPLILIAIGIAEIIDIISRRTRKVKTSKPSVKRILDDLEKGNINIDEAEEKLKE